MTSNLGLQLAAAMACDLPAEDEGDLVGIADGPAGVQQGPVPLA